MFRFLTDTFAKALHNIFAYSFVSEHSKHFLLILRKKKLVFLASERLTTPPLLNMPPKGSCKLYFFYVDEPLRGVVRQEKAFVDLILRGSITKIYFFLCFPTTKTDHLHHL